jgi:hypothetical protein
VGSLRVAFLFGATMPKTVKLKMMLYQRFVHLYNKKRHFLGDFYHHIFIITSIYTRIFFRCNLTPRKHEEGLPAGLFGNLTPLLVIWELKEFFELSSIGQNNKLSDILSVSSYFKVSHQACPAHWFKPLKQQSCFMAVIIYNYTRFRFKSKNDSF